MEDSSGGSGPGWTNSVSALADAEQVTRATMSRMLKGMMDDGLVEKTSSPNDGRGRLIQATNKGTKILRKARQVRLDALEDLMSALPKKDVAALQHAAMIINKIADEASKN